MKAGIGKLSRLVILAVAMAMPVFAVLASSAAALPDERGYELVTPPDTGAAKPGFRDLGAAGNLRVDCFNTNAVAVNSPGGGLGVAFMTPGGSIPGLPGVGTDDLYEAQRSPEGWTTLSKSPLASQSMHPEPERCLSEDHAYSTLLTFPPPTDEGSFVLGGETSYVRMPDGSFHLVGQGTVGTDPRANVKWISAGEPHVIFTSTEKLLPEAPDSVGSSVNHDGNLNPAADAIYDLTAEGLKVVSLLPGGSVPDPATETTFYVGASKDGTAVAFEVVRDDGSATIYLHLPGGTVPVATASKSGGFLYAGMSKSGDRMVLVESEEASGKEQWGNIVVFDPSDGTTIPITTAGEAAVVNVSADASHVYFVSMKNLTGGETNPVGQAAVVGQPNVYVWTAADESTRFVATVDPADVGAVSLTPPEAFYNLARWTPNVVGVTQGSQFGWGSDPSRTTPSGSTFVFQSRANLTGNGGVMNIYRYEATPSSLVCISCPAAGVSAKSNAVLERTTALSAALGSGEGTSQVTALVVIPNVSDDGSTVFFNSKVRLVPEDEDKYDDVYEWRNGTLSLVSSGNSASGEVLYGMTPDGHDVFFTSEARLVPQDESGVISIYDAREQGGFPAPPGPPVPCSLEAESCQGPPSPPSATPAPGTLGFVGKQNPRPCRHHFGKKCHRRHNKKKHHHKRHHHTKRAAR